MLSALWWKTRTRLRKLQAQILGKPYVSKRSSGAFGEDELRARDVSLRWLAGMALSLFAVCFFILYLGTQMLQLSLWRWTRYCDSVKINGTWVGPVPEFPAPRYMFNIDESDSCSYEYIVGFERLSRKIPSDLRIEVWGDQSQLLLTSSLMCWVSGLVPWRAGALSFLPQPLASARTHAFSWSEADTCFGGAPTPDVAECRRVQDTASRDECYFHSLQFAWSVPAMDIQENPLVSQAHRVYGQIELETIDATSTANAPSDTAKQTVSGDWIPPAIKFRWAGSVSQMQHRINAWIQFMEMRKRSWRLSKSTSAEASSSPLPSSSSRAAADMVVPGGRSTSASAPASPSDVSDMYPFPNVLVISANLLQNSHDAATGHDLLKDLATFFNTLALNHRALRRIKIIFMEPSLPPSHLSNKAANAELATRRERVIELAASYGVPVIRTAHLVGSSPGAQTEMDPAYPGLSHHLAQLVLNFVKHFRT